MGNLKVTVRTEAGESHVVEAPSEIPAQELLDELLKVFRFKKVDARGNPLQWVLEDKDAGRTLDPRQSLERNGVRNGHVLYLNVRATIVPIIHVPDNESYSEAILGQVKVRDFIQGVVQKFGLRTASWRVYDKDLGRFLDLDKSLSENGVLTGHHLQLDRPKSPPVLKFVAAGLAALTLFAVIWFLNGRTRPSVTITLTPEAANLSSSGQQQFKVDVRGVENTAVQWSMKPEIGSISSDGVYTAPSSVSADETVFIIATSEADRSKSASARVKVNKTVASAVEVRPSGVNLGISGTTMFKANTAVKWSLSPGIGSISPEGLYKAPPSIGTEQVVTVTAASIAQPAQSGSATITLQPVNVTLSPANIQLKPSESVTFSATVTGTSDQRVRWLVSGPGAISQGGVYTAPQLISAAGTTVRAMSLADSTKFGTASVAMRGGPVPPPTRGDKNPTLAFALDPQQATLGAKEKRKFSALLKGILDPSVTWSVSGSGNISGDGTYSAPPRLKQEETVRVTATSKADSSKVAFATITLKPIVVTITPASANVQARGQFAFRANVANTSSNGVKWDVMGPGRITGDGVYTAPSSVQQEQIVYVIAQSKEDSSRTARATIRLRPYTGLTSGTLIWSGKMRQNAISSIEGRSASMGSVTGDPLPGLPVNIEIDNDRDFSIQQRPDSSNGWSQLVIRSKRGDGSSVSTLRITWKLR